MNEHDEEEFLTQIAAGTDPLTAWAANLARTVTTTSPMVLRPKTTRAGAA